MDSAERIIGPGLLTRLLQALLILEAFCFSQETPFVVTRAVASGIVDSNFEVTAGSPLGELFITNASTFDLGITS